MSEPRQREDGPPYMITDHLAIGPCRGAGGPTMSMLVEMGFKHDIDLNADYSERSLARVAGIPYHPVKTTDDLDVEVWLKNIQDVVDIIDEAARRGEKVYLHCTYGKGRSPTAAMAYLVSQGRSVLAAIESVKGKGELVWDEGNPYSKYTRILRAYSEISQKDGRKRRTKAALNRESARRRRTRPSA